MKKVSFTNRTTLYRTYRKFYNLQKRIRYMLQSGEFHALLPQFRKRLLQRLQMLYKRLSRHLEKHKLRWASAVVATVLGLSAATAGYQNPISLAGVVLDTDSKPIVIDLDNDGDLDVVVADATPALRFLENKNGFYIERTGDDNPLPAITALEPAPALGDVDGDGDIDIVVGDYFGNISYYQNYGGKFFEQTGETNPFDGIDAGIFATPELADIDGDSDLDLIVGEYYGEINYYRNQDTAMVRITGAENPFDGIDAGYLSEPAMGDFDGDGDLDLFLGDDTGVIKYYSNEEGTYTEQTGANNPADGIDLGTESTIDMADLNQDGAMDLVCGQRTAANLYYLANEEGTLVNKQGTGNPFEGIPVFDFLAPAFGDYDADGHRELLVGSFTNGTTFLENEGSFFHEVETDDNPFSGLGFSDAATPDWGDIDGDGDLDLIAGNTGGTIQYFFNDNGNYVELTGSGNPFDAISSSYTSPNLCDYDNDGDLDLFFGDAAGLIHYYENVADTYVERTGAENPFDGFDLGSYIGVHLKDVDGDEDFDMIVGDDSGNIFKYLENDEGTYIQRTGALNPFSHLTSFNAPRLDFFDFDGDGDEDLIAAHFDNGLYLVENIPAGLAINTGSGLTTTETGGTAIFTVVLESRPTATVFVDFTSTDPGEGTVNPLYLEFNSSDWDEPQFVTLTGQDDDGANDRGQDYEIEVLVTSDDPEYDSIPVANLQAHNLDDDGSSAIDEQAANTINVYAHGNIITIDAGAERIDRVDVYSVSGSLIRSENTHSEGRLELHMNDTQAGIYIVRTYSQGSVTTTKVILR